MCLPMSALYQVKTSSIHRLGWPRRKRRSSAATRVAAAIFQITAGTAAGRAVSAGSGELGSRRWGRVRASSVGPVPGEHGGNRLEEDLHVQSERPVLDVLEVEPHPFIESD